MERKFKLLDRVETTKYDDPQHEGYGIEGVIAEYCTYYNKEDECICSIDEDMVVENSDGSQEHLYIVLYHDQDDKMKFEEFGETELTLC